MKVNLISYTQNPEKLITVAAHGCYSKKSGIDLMDTQENKKVGEFVSRLIKSGHTSTLEHAVFTFSIEGVSRALSHQLVRHRMASYCQQSQRYVDASDFTFFLPDSIKEDAEAKKLYFDTIENCRSTYKNLVAKGIKKEDARYVLPNATTTKLVMTMNARELLHFFELRLGIGAQAEIKELAREMLDIVTPIAPHIFENVVNK